MDKTTYDYIINYCSIKYKGILGTTERDFVLRKFLDSYYEALKSFEENNPGKKPTEIEEQTIMSSLMNDNTMNSFIDSAKSFYADYRASVENEYQRKLEKPIFWKNVWTSVIANFIYSAILIVVFLIAKDQIATWLFSLGK